MRIFGFWGKAQGGWHLLPYHSLDVAACAVALLQRRPRAAETLVTLTGLPVQGIEACLAWAAALHDLGKLSPDFQWKVPVVASALGQQERAAAGAVRHDSLGWVLWWDGLRRSSRLAPDALARADVWLRSSMGHHGEPPSRAAGRGLPIRMKQYFPGDELAAAEEWLAFLDRKFAPDWSAGNLPALRRASWWIAGLVNLADWLGSSTEWFPYEPKRGDLFDYWETASQRARTAVDESGLGRGPTRRSFAELFPGYQPTPLQSAVAGLDTREPFLLILEEATGGGKTECALAAAGGDAFFFGLPTMATANGLWARVGALDGQQTLIHGKRWLLPAAMGRASAWINDSSRKAMLANIGVGTVDQAMLAVLKARFGALRLFALAGRTLIIDEVHAYDPYMTRILERLVQYHSRAGGSVVLLSATMPLTVRQGLADAWARGRGLDPADLSASDFPLLSFRTGAGLEQRDLPSYRRQELRIEYLHDIDECIDQIRDSVASGACIAWVRNTVREAIEAYDALCAAGVSATLFHARFAQGDRIAIEARVCEMFGKGSKPEARRGQVLIATQVVEQSLDLDFDQMITDIAPVDLMIQRAGRLHRHERGPRGTPVLIVHAPPWTVTPNEGWIENWSMGTARVYPDHGRLWLTMHLLGSRVVLPEDSRRLVEGVYGAGSEGAVPLGLQSRTGHAMQRQGRLRVAALANEIGPEAEYSTDGAEVWTDEEAPTRLGERSREWVLCERGAPIKGDVERSVVSVRVSAIARAPGCRGLAVGSWRATIELVDGAALCERPDGRRIEVRYDVVRGLTWGA